VSCSFCGVGDSSIFQAEDASAGSALKPGKGKLKIQIAWRKLDLPAQASESGEVEVATTTLLCPPGGTITGELTIEGDTIPFMGKSIGVERTPAGAVTTQRFAHYTPQVQVTKFKLAEPKPTSGCV